ncbi:MAG TPA: Gldg family protein [Candidatus Acidoferrum sp.]|nr:Gldg family protein [Candidatus Acidoferrum sp.]
MKSAPPGNPSASGASSRRVWLLSPVFVLSGIVLAGFWLKFGLQTPGFLSPASRGAVLSDRTREYLSHLSSPVEIRFYAVLPPDSAPDALRDFSGRVERLLSEFQSANEREIRLACHVSTATTNVDAAVAEGLQAFNLDKGNACFLGITVASGGRQETLGRLQPEWEPALEFDLARAITRVTAAPATAGARPAPTPPISPETTNAVLRLIPDIKNTSLEEGRQILRGAAMQEIIAAGAEADKQIELARQQLADAQNSGSETQQQAARQHLQDVQMDQTDKIRNIASRLQEELSVFEQMKAGDTPAK